ncbi:MAG: hypothetical protein M1115_09570 [Actinobacteria bacterium]|nr:hypothetical protein [Actinomycetota bacterium]
MLGTPDFPARATIAIQFGMESGLSTCSVPEIETDLPEDLTLGVFSIKVRFT